MQKGNADSKTKIYPKDSHNFRIGTKSSQLAKMVSLTSSDSCDSPMHPIDFYLSSRLTKRRNKSNRRIKKSGRGSSPRQCKEQLLRDHGAVAVLLVDDNARTHTSRDDFSSGSMRFSSGNSVHNGSSFHSSSSSTSGRWNDYHERTSSTVFERRNGAPNAAWPTRLPEDPSSLSPIMPVRRYQLRRQKRAPTSIPLSWESLRNIFPQATGCLEFIDTQEFMDIQASQVETYEKEIVFPHQTDGVLNHRRSQWGTILKRIVRFSALNATLVLSTGLPSCWVDCQKRKGGRYCLGAKQREQRSFPFHLENIHKYSTIYSV